MIRVALAIYCLSKYNKEYVLDFAKHARKRRRTTLVEVDGEECPISQWFLDADLDKMLSVFTPETKEEVAIRTEAVKFVAERRAVEWVAAQNFHFAKTPGERRVRSAWFPTFQRSFGHLVLSHLFDWTRPFFFSVLRLCGSRQVVAHCCAD